MAASVDSGFDVNMGLAFEARNQAVHRDVVPGPRQRHAYGTSRGGYGYGPDDR